MCGRDRTPLTPPETMAEPVPVPAMSLFIRRDDPARCPNCGQRVTPYAAGCWLCGAALDPTRWQPAAGPLARALARWRGLLGRRD
jgi:predicted amidophosphoribosyltransferase